MSLPGLMPRGDAAGSTREAGFGGRNPLRNFPVNYRHAYHAGNPADVLKHVVLVLLLEALRAKEKPFCVLDTHAGIGRYDLTGIEAGKTGEFRDGIGRLLEASPSSPALAAYLDLVRAENGAGPGLSAYPGSPRIARAMLRSGDRLVLVELHPEDEATLRGLFRGDPQVSIHRRDAYEALRALLPPPERRGLVLVDPAFEVADEFQRMVAGIRAAHRRWETGLYALWYPIKHDAPVERFHGELAMTGIRRMLVVEMTLYRDRPADRLNGSGLVIVNPPWRLEEQLREALPPLHSALAKDGGGVRIEWLVPE